MAWGIRPVVIETHGTPDEIVWHAVEAATHRIGANPPLGARGPHLASPRYRFWSVPGYRTLLAYTDATDPPRIVRIVHTSQDLPRVLADVLA